MRKYIYIIQQFDVWYSRLNDVYDNAIDWTVAYVNHNHSLGMSKCCIFYTKTYRINKSVNMLC